MECIIKHVDEEGYDYASVPANDEKLNETLVDILENNQWQLKVGDSIVIER